VADPDPSATGIDVKSGESIGKPPVEVHVRMESFIRNHCAELISGTIRTVELSLHPDISPCPLQQSFIPQTIGDGTKLSELEEVVGNSVIVVDTTDSNTRTDWNLPRVYSEDVVKVEGDLMGRAVDKCHFVSTLLEHFPSVFQEWIILTQ